MENVNSLLGSMSKTPTLNKLYSAVVKDTCDNCGAELDELDKQLGQEFTDGSKFCQKCFEQGQDYLDDKK